MAADGQHIVIHCKEVVGRTGLVTARLMIELGTHPEQAINSVQKARPESLHLYSHEKYCYSLAIGRPTVTQNQSVHGERMSKIFIIDDDTYITFLHRCWM
jgi:protein-tyrosine phosphatase